ncbi:hypothetical protein TCAL_02414 [Tigriopus californicus]|uniref:CENP-V/GFA domain-containing protein n=2 Tax=Tigriopus californicus TaxID=6832 RepID=A0A553NYB7_TIGCA|nr:centromere protein V-like isoform X2 [Tigriopus californicus]XP_059091590.1 centromere protein V-like isoform X2 [Tigriopus californicus]TRY70402.1 hypothetical protein TCAL_02414 [Tigriopus californicus]|eukprot:TCALIF_02414-PA protein Name:"Similar to Cenpv Centromere protein V (Mus musculus)" AED:0.10 eAED:0.10 QI:136/1/1/1/0.33/0.5/4/30/134
MESSDLMKHIGGCHCGQIEFEVQAPVEVNAISCNCSVCHMKQNIHFIVPNHHFKLTKGNDKLTTYTFNTHQAKHTFCSICGVQSFYTPRSNPDGKGIMPHCIKYNTIKKIHITDFNGDQWEQEIEKSGIRLRSS